MEPHFHLSPRLNLDIRLNLVTNDSPCCFYSLHFINQQIDPSSIISSLFPSDALQNCQIHFPKNHFIITSTAAPRTKRVNCSHLSLVFKSPNTFVIYPLSTQPNSSSIPNILGYFHPSLQPSLSLWKPLLFAIWPKPGILQSCILRKIIYVQWHL